MEDESAISVEEREEATQASPPESGDKPARKKKIKKILLVTLCAVLGVIALAVVVLAPIIATGNKVIVPDTEEPVYALENWMAYISDDAPVTSLAIPGSHDSGCYDKMGYLGTTQNLPIAEQLVRGVRYFDIRVNDSNKGPVIFHGPINGVPYSEVLTDIAEFVDTHPTEFLILDCQHFKNDSEEIVFDLLEEYVGVDKFVINDTNMRDIDFVESLTLGDVRGKCFVYIDAEVEYDEKEYLFYRGKDVEEYPEISLMSLYERSKNGSAAAKFAEKVLPGYIEQFVEERGRGFFVLQAQLTDTLGVFGPSYREGRAIGYINDFVRGLYDDDMMYDVNVIMRDFVTCEKSALTLRLNIVKGLVAEDKADEFEDMIALYV